MARREQELGGKACCTHRREYALHLMELMYEEKAELCIQTQGPGSENNTAVIVEPGLSDGHFNSHPLVKCTMSSLSSASLILDCFVMSNLLALKNYRIH